MQKWDVEPSLVAAMTVEQFPYEAEQIALDFLEAATNACDPRKTLFWTLVLNQVEQMQIKLTGEPDYARGARFGAVM